MLRFFWYLVYANQPPLLALGLLDFFGREAKFAANDFAKGLAAVFLALALIAAIVGPIYLVLR